MSHLVVNANTFAAEAVAGFAAANPRYVRQVDGGVVRSTLIPQGHVALVVGGGSGHYPGYTGFVGSGLGSGAVCGNIFASPSSGQVYRVAKAVERGAGVLLAIGNYAGDVLHFGIAAERLRGEGIDVRLLAMTDDVASSPPDQIEIRRGIAGCLAIVKVAGAATEAGMSLDEVERIARMANGRTRTLGVAFSGCTLPGATAPLFTVPAGRMAFGLGIHGEPGVAEFPLMDAASLADLLVGKLLEDMPPMIGARRAVVILNGLGSFKYEELFVLFGAVHARLTKADVAIADSECGEFITSLDMAGVSLTLFWVNDELEALWNAPADSPGFRRGLVNSEPDGLQTPEKAPVARQAYAEQTRGDFRAVSSALDGLRRAYAALVDSESELGRLDSVAGDGDHGLCMARGAAGAVRAAERVTAEGGSLARLLTEAGEGWADQSGGASGALWGAALSAAGDSLDDEPDACAVSRAVDVALAAVRRLGKAEVGDKTMVDAFAPFAKELGRSISAGMDLREAWQAASLRATDAAAGTAELVPRMGRARTHGERSVGHCDPGAISFALVVNAVWPGRHI